MPLPDIQSVLDLAIRLGGTMDVKQASFDWGVPKKAVKAICEHMGIDPKNIPEDTVPVYVPEKVILNDPHRVYIYLLDVISNKRLELEDVDNDLLITAMEELKRKGLIVAIQGRDPHSTDYHDYMVSANREEYLNWYYSRTNESMGLLKKIGSLFT